MTEESTLDAFVSEPNASSEETGDRASEGTTGPDGAGRDAVEPVAVTSSWRGEDAACASCGESTGRLWENDGGRVCSSCKPWTRPGDD